ncbi:hypothetical protein HIM_06123 [Hirsutella minnesotensis 3608]|uniref:Uncharacterized protein n=1 Tax=Hirsutella minnesotensis 3608 TaxID=1043627 RepID=A0A0F7ZZN4_9HYPO|nr:hypothetical protein HIM_06123 [Hirsutella minnesotensis 3608]
MQKGPALLAWSVTAYGVEARDWWSRRGSGWPRATREARFVEPEDQGSGPANRRGDASCRCTDNSSLSDCCRLVASHLTSPQPSRPRRQSLAYTAASWSVEQGQGGRPPGADEQRKPTSAAAKARIAVVVRGLDGGGVLVWAVGFRLHRIWTSPLPKDRLACDHEMEHGVPTAK